MGAKSTLSDNGPRKINEGAEVGAGQAASGKVRQNSSGSWYIPFLE